MAEGRTCKVCGTGVHPEEQKDAGGQMLCSACYWDKQDGVSIRASSFNGPRF